MLFNAPEFLFIFLPIIAGLYYLVPRLTGYQNIGLWRIRLLFIASLFFYGYWHWPYLFLLLISILFNYRFSEFLSPNTGRKNLTRKSLLALGITLNLGMLGYYKYAGFLVANIGAATGLTFDTVNILLPIGISFFTFQQIAWLVDRYEGSAASKSFWHYGLFVSFFPQLIAGPIVHHKAVMPWLEQLQRQYITQNLQIGLSVFILGLAKKMLIADNLALLSSPVFDQTATGNLAPDITVSWIAAIAYSLQIYFDFSGYSDMAIGLGLMFGIRLPLNFNSPYQASSIIDFWRRWHMTLSAFLRDYLYIPLGGNKYGRYRKALNIVLTMTIGGIWHGAAWQFLFWGMIHGFAIMINHGWRHLNVFKLPVFSARLLTLTFVILAWIPFRAQDIETSMKIYAGMFGQNGLVLPVFLQGYLDMGLSTIRFSGLDPINHWGLLFLLFTVFCTSQFMRNVAEQYRYVPNMPEQQINNLTRRRSAFLGVLLAACILKMNDVSEFLYFQF